MEGCQQTVLDRVWVCVSYKTSSTRTDLGYVVALHQVLNEINKTKRLLFSPPQFVAKSDNII
jgi:hypothetical protein